MRYLSPTAKKILLMIGAHQLGPDNQHDVESTPLDLGRLVITEDRHFLSGLAELLEHDLIVKMEGPGHRYSLTDLGVNELVYA
jgi:hypothetical protein